ncbi:MAG: helix-turn-helix domain-containing protein [Pseudomonadota bacterium]
MDKVFKALSDPARRALLDLLRSRDGRTLGELEKGLAEAGFEMTRFGVMKHLKTLEEAGLVLTRKAGRFKHHHLNALPLQEAIDRWIEPFRVRPLVRSMIDLKTQLEEARTMSEKPDFVIQTFIKCGRDALWDALTDPERIAAHHFAANAAEATPEGGHRVLTPEGAPMLTQKLIRAEPKSRLELSFEPHWFGPDAPASKIAFLIEEEGSGVDAVCKLTCEHYALPPGQEGVREGWARHLASLKSWLETGRPIKMAR